MQMSSQSFSPNKKNDIQALNFFAGLLDADDKGEYYREPGLSDAQAQACRSCDTEARPQGCRLRKSGKHVCVPQGSMLRQEVYALDGTLKAEHPVHRQRAELHDPAPATSRRQSTCMFFAHAHETIGYQYERNPADPRISHTVTLEVDDLGNVLKQASEGYGRRQPDPNPLLHQADRDKQTRMVSDVKSRRRSKPSLDQSKAEMWSALDGYGLAGLCSTTRANPYASTNLSSAGCPIDANLFELLNDVAGKPIRSWDNRGTAPSVMSTTSFAAPLSLVPMPLTPTKSF